MSNYEEILEKTLKEFFFDLLKKNKKVVMSVFTKYGDQDVRITAQMLIDEIEGNEEMIITEDDKLFDSSFSIFNGMIKFNEFVGKNNTNKKSLFKYLKNMYIYSIGIIRPEELTNTFNKFKKIINPIHEIEKVMPRSNNNALSDIIGSITSEIVPQLQKSFSQENFKLNPNDIMGSLSSSGIDIFSIVNSISSKIDKKIKNGSINEQDLQNQAMNMLKGSDFSSFLSGQINKK